MEPRAAIRVLLADDHPMVRRGLRTFLETTGEIEVVGEAIDGEEAVQLVQHLQPDVVLMDLVMPRRDGIAAIRALRAAGCTAAIIALTSFVEDSKVFPALRAGATGYLLKDVQPEELLRAVRAAHQGKVHLHPEVARKLVQDFAGGPTGNGEPRAEVLTEREVDVLRCIAKGLSNREIASVLVLSEPTVKGHVSNILAKLEVADRTQAALWALRHGVAFLE